MRSYRKRTFRARSFPRELVAVTRTLPRLLRAYASPTLAPALREKVMLATTSVNDCRYCAWVHGHLAVAHGVDLEELRAQLAGTSLAPCDDREALAVLYARHYAESRGDPDPRLVQQVRDTFGPRCSEELFAYVEGIHFANLTGNTLDALLDRIRSPRRQ